MKAPFSPPFYPEGGKGKGLEKGGKGEEIMNTVGGKKEGNKLMNKKAD